MKREVPPSAVSELVSYPALPYTHPGKDAVPKSVFAQVSKDGNWAWKARDSVLEVFSTQTQERFSSWRFGAVLKNSSLTISAIGELCSPSIKYPCLLLGLNSEGEGGFLCMFNGRTSKVVKVIELPYKITSIEAVNAEGGVSVGARPLNPILRLMSGLAAIGTENGHILFVDLCLDEENYSDEIAPNKIILITKNCNNIAVKREAAVVRSHHLCLSLNDNSIKYDTFEYQNPNNTVLPFSSDDVMISGMKYVQSLVALVVGFSFGGVEIWSLQNLSLMQTFPIHSSERPVIHFAFQEPENDPRNFCYLWTFTGCYQGENYKSEGISVATLYSLTYSQKNWVVGFGNLYQGLQGCSKRFEYPLTPDPYCPIGQSSSYCSRLISCRVPPLTDTLRFDNEDSLQNEADWSNYEDLSLCVMAWEILPNMSNAPSSCYLAVFDLNQWYQAQMPSVLRCNPGELPSFLGIFSLQEITNKLNLESLLDVYAIPHSLTKFKCLSVAEEFFYPSSLSFKILCTSLGGVIHANYLGTQRQLLFEMNQAGPNCLVDPKELFGCCMISGLLNNIHEVIPGRQIAAVLQREALLTLAFENSMFHFIHACMQKWKTGEFSQFGCSSKFVLDWAWKKITQIKSSTDKLCQPLFNCSGQNLDKTTLQTIHSYGSQLMHLTEIITSFKNLPGPKTEQGQRELTLKAEVVQSIAVYIQILIRLYDCHLLPEHMEDNDNGEDEVAYPVSRLDRIYSCRRLEIQKLHSSVAATDILLVDGLVAEIGTPLTSLWEAKGGNDTYPPPSFYAAVSMYLLDGVSVAQKHQLLYYLILDMAMLLSDNQTDLGEKLMRFPQACDLSSSISKLTHAFWLLDHQDFEAAVATFLDPIILSVDIPPWCHNRILKSFLYQGHQKKALNYMNVRKPPQSNAEEIKLHLSILLANGLTSEAFYFQRQHQSEENYEDLLNHLFLSCQQTHTLYALLQMPLSSIESTVLADFLNSSLDPRSQEMLVMFYLLRCRPLEAANLNDKLTTQIVERNPKCQERAKIRSALVAGFLSTLPEEQKKLAQEIRHLNIAVIGNNETVPQPLSSSITCSSLKVLSYSDMLRKLLAKVKAASFTAESTSIPYPETNVNTSVHSSLDSTPFLGPPMSLQSEKKRRRLSNVVFATPVSKTPVKRASDGSDFASPPKKSVFGESSYRVIDSERRRSVRHLSGDLLSLLQTPPICRKSSKLQSSGIVENAPTITPQSILKMRSGMFRTSSPPPVIKYDAKTPSLSSKDNNDESSEDDEIELNITTLADKKAPAHEDIQSKHLRFQDPSPPHSSPMLKSGYPQSGYSSARSLSNSSLSSCSERAVRVSPRRPLRDFDISSCSEHTDVFVDARTSICSSPGNNLEYHSSMTPVSRFSSYTNVNTEDEGMEVAVCDEERSLIIDCRLAGNVNEDELHDMGQKENGATRLNLAAEDHIPEMLSADGDMDDLTLHLSESESESGVTKEAGNTPQISSTLEKHDDDDLMIPPNECLHEELETMSEKITTKRLSTSENDEDTLHTPTTEFTQIKSLRAKVSSSYHSENELLQDAEEKRDNLLSSSEMSTPVKDIQSRSEDSKSSALPSPIVISEEQVYYSANSLALHSSPYQRTRSKSKSLSPDKKEAPKPVRTMPVIPSPGLLYTKFKPIETKTKFTEISKPENSGQKVLEPELLKDTPVVKSEPSLVVAEYSESSKAECETPKSQKPAKSAFRSSTRRRSMKASSKKLPKPEFSFSNPNVSDDAGILDAISSTPEMPMPSFVFSPPVTRAKLKQKKMDETMNSSYMSVASETSFRSRRKHFVDPLLLDSSIVSIPEGRTLSSGLFPTSSAKKSGMKKKRSLVPSDLPVSRNIINLLSPIDIRDSSLNESSQSLSASSKHNMVLRRKKKRKSVKLF